MMAEIGIETAHVIPRKNGYSDQILRIAGFRKRLLILGDGALANNLARVLGERGNYRYEVVGFLSLDPSRVGGIIFPSRVIGTTERLFELAERHKIQTVAVCFEDRRGTMPMDTLLDVKAMGIDVIDGHLLYEEQCGRLSIDELKPSFLIFSTGFQRKPVLMVVKRLIDVLGSLLGLILSDAPYFFLLPSSLKLILLGPFFIDKPELDFKVSPTSFSNFARCITMPKRKGSSGQVFRIIA